MAGGTHAQTTDANGAGSFTSVTETSLGVTATRSVPAAEAVATNQALTLADAISGLRLVAGLEITAPNRTLSPYQALAADYDGDGAVRLNDAIDLLRHVAGLPSPDPVWRFVNEIDASIPSRANLTPGVLAATVSVNLAGAAVQVHAGLVGILSGDIDGSFAGAQGSQDLDLLQPTYFTDLTRDHGLTLAQFGVYP